MRLKKLEDIISGIMKNSEIISAIVGGTFFALPYLALSMPIIPSLAIGAAAFAAGYWVQPRGIEPNAAKDFRLGSDKLRRRSHRPSIRRRRSRAACQQCRALRAACRQYADE